MSGTDQNRPGRDHDEHPPQPGAHEEAGAAFDPSESTAGGGDQAEQGPGNAPRAVPQGLPVSESVYNALKRRAAAGGRGRSGPAQHDPAAGPDDSGPEGSDDGGEIPQERR